MPRQRTLPYGVEEGQNYPEPDLDVKDGEDLARVRRRVEVAVPDGSQRYYAEVQRVEQAPSLGLSVEEGPAEQEQEEEEAPELGVSPRAVDDPEEPGQDCQERCQEDLRGDARAAKDCIKL